MAPSVRTGAAFARAGTEVVLWGGCDPAVKGECRPTRDGFAFDPQTVEWQRIADAPAGGAFAEEVSTASGAVFFTENEGGPATAQLYDSVTESWTRLPAPPLATVSEAVWTGTELLAWSEGSRRRPRTWRGAGYDFVRGQWRRLADAPFALNLTSGVWTGTEAILYGSLLDGRNWAETERSVGEAYAPATDSWRRLPRSGLSPQATSAVLAGGEMVAWDYETDYQVYDPVTDRWTKRADMPFEFSECYPDSEVVLESVFAFFCGDAAVFDTVLDRWREVRGGPLNDKLGGAAQKLDLWRFASLESTGPAVYLLLEGVTLTKRDVPCYGCPGASRAFWSFRPRIPTS